MKAEHAQASFDNPKCRAAGRITGLSHLHGKPTLFLPEES
jgi:hypothetical protein